MRELLKRDLIDGEQKTVDGRTLAKIAADCRGDARASRSSCRSRPAQADRRPGDPPRLAGARGLRHQAGRPRADVPPRPGARLRLRDGLLRGGPLRLLGRRGPLRPRRAGVKLALPQVVTHRLAGHAGITEHAEEVVAQLEVPPSGRPIRLSDAASSSRAPGQRRPEVQRPLDGVLARLVALDPLCLRRIARPARGSDEVEVLPDGRAPVITIGPLSEDEAEQCFCDTMEKITGQKISRAMLQASQKRLCALAGGHPFIVARLAELSTQLPPNFLLEHDNEAVAHDQLIYDVGFGIAYARQLSPAAQRLFLTCSLFPADCSATVARQLVPPEDGPALPLLQQIAACNLWRLSQDQRRFHIVSLVRSCAHRRLRQDVEGLTEAAALAAGIAAMRTVAHKQAPLTDPGKLHTADSHEATQIATEAMHWFDDEWGNLLFCAREAFAHRDYPTVIALADTVLQFCIRRGKWGDDAQRLFRQAFDGARTLGDPVAIAHGHNNLGVACQFTGRLADAAAHFQAAIAGFEAVEHHLHTAKALNSLAWVKGGLATDYEAAEGYLQRALQLCTAGDAWDDETKAELSQTFNNLGELLTRRERFPEALAAFNNSLRLRQEVHDALRYGQTLNRRGNCLRLMGESERAEKDLDQSIRELEPFRDHFELGTSWERLGDVHKTRGKPLEAMAAYRESIEYFRQATSHVDAGRVGLSLARLLASTGDPAKALIAANQAVETLESTVDEQLLRDAYTVVQDLTAAAPLPQRLPATWARLLCQHDGAVTAQTHLHACRSRRHQAILRRAPHA